MPGGRPGAGGVVSGARGAVTSRAGPAAWSTPSLAASRSFALISLAALVRARGPAPAPGRVLGRAATAPRRLARAGAGLVQTALIGAVVARTTVCRSRTVIVSTVIARTVVARTVVLGASVVSPVLAAVVSPVRSPRPIPGRGPTRSPAPAGNRGLPHPGYRVRGGRPRNDPRARRHQGRPSGQAPRDPGGRSRKSLGYSRVLAGWVRQSWASIGPTAGPHGIRCREPSGSG